MEEIWQYIRGEYRCYMENLEAARRIMRWKSVQKAATHYYPGMRLKAFEFIFPTRSYKRIAEALVLPKKIKSVGRVKQGQRLQKVDRIAEVKSSNLTPVED